MNTSSENQVEQRLRDVGLEVPAAPEAVGSYVPVLRNGQLVVTSGQLPLEGKELPYQGRVGDQLTIEEAAAAARLCALNALAQIRASLGSLDRVARIVRLEGYIASADGFTGQAPVLNGASDVMTAAFGEAGRHTRIAVGVSQLPLGAPVELAVWAETDQ